MIGSTISHYRILEELGRGGMGIVYKAVDMKLDREVALKFLPAALATDTEAKERFIQEAKSASSLDHQNICTIHEIDEDEEGRVFIAMACYEGQTIRNLIANGPLALEQTIDYARQTARGLSEAHKAGIIHRDIKPGNLMVTDQGVVKILDFGLAKVTDASLTTQGKRYGTVVYMSPEQARGERVTPSTDIWSLGAVLYEMLTGVRPFDAPYESAIFYAIINVDPVPPREHNPEIPEDLERIVLRCLAKSPSNRYTDIEELVDEFRRLDETGSTTPQLTSTYLPKASPPLWRAWYVRAFLLALVVFVILHPAARKLLFTNWGQSLDLAGIAVQPFTGTTSEPDLSSLAHGVSFLSHQLLTNMERVDQDFWVVPYDEYEEQQIASLSQAASDLYVRHRLSGSVSETDTHLRVSLTLHEADTGSEIASKSFRSALDEAGDFLRSLTDELSALVDLQLGEGLAITDSLDLSPDAYWMYIRALGLLSAAVDSVQLGEALDLLNYVLDNEAAFPQALGAAGLAEWRMYEQTRNETRLHNAIDRFERAISYGQVSSETRVLLANALDQVDRDDEAEAVLTSAIVSDSLNSRIHLRIARLLEDSGRPERAESAYYAAIRLKPNYWRYRWELGLFYFTRDEYDKAAEQFGLVTELAPTNARAFNALAVQYQRRGDLVTAESLYSRATRVNLNQSSVRAVAFQNLGGIHYRKDEFREAAEMYEQSLRMDSSNYNLWTDLGNIHHWLGNRSEAERTWRHAIVLAEEEVASNPRSSSGLGLIALNSAKLGEEATAREALDRLLSYRFTTARPMYVIGKTYEILGEREKAREFIGIALDRGFSMEVIEASRWLDNFRQDPNFQCRFTGDPCI